MSTENSDVEVDAESDDDGYFDYYDEYFDYYKAEEDSRSEVEPADPKKTDPEYFEFKCLTPEEANKFLNERVETLCASLPNDSEKKKVWKDILVETVLKTAGTSAVILKATKIVLPLIGFGPLGPVAGSLAASYQSSVLGGTIASGSAFSTLQSFGMVGLSTAAQATVIGGCAAASTASTVYCKFKDKKGKDEKDKGGRKGKR